MASACARSDVSATSSTIPYNQPKRFKVFIQRDYSQGTDVKFQTKFPAELEGIIEKKTYEQSINGLNRIYLEAEKINGSAFWEGCLACLTSYLIYTCIETRYQRCLKRAAAYIDEQNETVFGPRGLNIKDPIERGLRVIEITGIIESQDSLQY